MKTRRFLGWVAMATMVLSTGCSNDEVVEDFSPENAIEFGTYLGKDAESRGSVLDTEGLKEQGFGVFAYYTGTEKFTGSETANFMRNTKVTYDGTASAWTYSPLKYWPNNVNDKVSFLAYAPWNAAYVVNNDEKGDNDILVSGTTINYTVPNTVKDHIDLTWNNQATTNLTKQTVEGEVKFVFQHALSKIGFTRQAAVDELSPDGKTLDENTSIFVKRVILSKTKVTYDATNNKYTIPQDCFYKSADLELNNTTTTASWSNHSTTGLQSFELKDGVELDNTIINESNSLTKMPLNKEDSYLMIIPQNFAGTGFNVFIEYEVVTKGFNAAGKDDSFTITNRINTAIDPNFESGKQYNLNLIIGMTSVKVEATVDSWVDANETIVDVPKNTSTPSNP